MVLNSLPPEIVLYIFSYLPLSSLSQLSCVSRPWNTFLLQHEATVYRHAAFLHGFIDDDSVSLESMKTSNKYSERVLADVDSWKKLCKNRIRVRNAWNGVAPSEMRPVPVDSPDLFALKTTHRIKVDEKRGLIMTTTGSDIIPRVIVRDMDTGATLWWLEPTMGTQFAHLEYSEGFLIFDRNTGDREVWRLTDPALRDTVHAVLCPEIPVDFDESSRPDSAMLRNSQISLTKALSHLDFEPTAGFRPNGCFEPYALLHSPEETRAYRFVYPTLLTAARDRVYLWDVPSARIVEVIEGIQRATVSKLSKSPKVDTFSDAHENFGAEAQDQEDADMSETPNIALYFNDEGEDDNEDDQDAEDEDDEDDGDLPPFHVPSDLTLLRSIRYVDHSPTHIFLAGQYILKVFCRACTSGDGGFEAGGRNSDVSHQLALALTSTKLHYGRWKYTIRPGSGKQEIGTCLVRYEIDVHDGGGVNLTENLYDQFKAVHVSPCGSHFVALLGGSRILIVPHFRRLVGQSEDVIYNAILDVQLSSPYSTKSVYLAYEEGDAGEGRVGVVTTGAVFIVTLPQFPLNNRMDTPPTLHVSRVKEWLDREQLNHVSCLMLSDTRLFVNYDLAFWNMPLQKLEAPFEKGLEDLQILGTRCYHISEQALFVRDWGGLHLRRYDSMVYEIDMLPG